jgi:DoxX-like protein
LAVTTPPAERARQLAIGLAGFQVVDALGNALVPRRYIDAHLDHLGLPPPLRPLLQVIKVGTAAGLVLGLRSPRIGAATSAALVAYYSAAVTFHVLSHDHPVIAAPAAACGGAAATTLVRLYLPALERP